jgi:transcriptional/translational regulatory protein YebC/TACO1
VRLVPANTPGSTEPGAKAVGNDGSRLKAAAPGTIPTGWLDEDALLEDLLALEDLGGPAVLTYELDGDPGQRSGAELVTAYPNLEALQDELRSRGWPVASWEHRWIAQTSCQVSDSQVLGSCLNLLDALEELDDVRSVTTNLEAEERLMEGVVG